MTRPIQSGLFGQARACERANPGGHSRAALGARDTQPGRVPSGPARAMLLAVERSTFEGRSWDRTGVNANANELNEGSWPQAFSVILDEDLVSRKFRGYGPSHRMRTRLKGCAARGGFARSVR